MTLVAAARTAADPDMLRRLVDRGRTMLREQRPKEALAMLERAVAIPAAPAEAFGLFAEALSEMGRKEEALAAAETAVAANQANGALRMLRGRMRRDCGDRRGATDDAAAAVMVDPADPDAKTLLATCLSESGQHDEALLLFHQAFTAQPGDAHRAAMLAMAFMRAGKHEAAEEVFGLASQLSQGARGVLLLRAQNAILAGSPRDAVEMLRKGPESCAEDGSFWALLGQSHQKLGEIDEAAAAFREAARVDPGNAYLRHLAMAIGAMPVEGDRAHDQYITEVFDGFATRFEESLFALGYRIPGVMLRMVEARQPGLAAHESRLGDVLDLGCGTGLMGAVLHDLLGGRLVGVDLSPRMLEATREKGVYTELRCGEVVAEMERDEAHYALILLADVLCYFGALDRCFEAARARLAPGGQVLFSVERGEEGSDWALLRSGRYRHDADYVRAALARAGLSPIEFAEEVLRYENGQPVNGFIVMAEAAQ